MEMNNTDLPNPVPIFRGAVQKAAYKKQLVPRYSGSPIIEALPSILSAEDSAKLMAYYPELVPNAQKLPPEIRMHLIMDALHFFQPLPIHMDLEQRVSRIIRDNYVGRDPLAKDQWINLDQSVSAILKGGGIPMASSNVNGFSIIGIPGIGKTTGIERVLLLSPQVIHHEFYEGKPFNRIQLAWLKLTCPHDGSVKALCLEFFRVVDGVLDTHYLRDYAGEGHRTVDELIAKMWRVAWIHCLGLLVIDEIQHLNQAKSGGAERMLNFFLQLMNTLGVPIIMIGTYAAVEVLQRGLRQIRRSCGQGDLVWDAMPNDDVWRLFIESLWKFQYTQFPVPLTQEIVDAIHYESAGIVDFAVKIFLLAQTRAIATGEERITLAIIRSVAKDSLRLAQPALHAIRTGDMSNVSLMSDLHPIDFASAVRQIRKTGFLQTLSQGSYAASDVNAKGAIRQTTGITGGEGMAADSTQPIPAPLAQQPPKPRRSKGAPSSSKCLLVQLMDAGVSKGVSPHDALAQAGLIQPLFKFQTSPATV
jgi:hypothetical protein